jgi:energy-coupling factor transporter ATP-binding protein EcfA2
MTVKNYRAFKYQRFEFSNINLFVGPNNSGKSSAISALNLLAQTVSAGQSGVPLVLRGKYDDLGTYIDLIHRNMPRSIFGIEFSIPKYNFKIDYKYRSQRREIEIVKYEISEDDKFIFQYKTRKDAYDIRYRGKKLETYFKPSIKRRPKIDGLQVNDPNIRQLRMFGSRNLFMKKADSDDTVRNLISVDRDILRANYQLRGTFDSFDSLSPFRQQPQRTFLFSGEVPGQIGKTGDNTVDLVVADSFARGRAKRGIVDQVSSFFRKTGMARDLKVIALTPRHFELCLIANDGTRHNICDVGFGCSQVLPVLVGALNLFFKATPRSHSPIFVVQEPEIHLHPDAQANLGSFFVELAKERGQFFIETHSDNLILRIQRHVAAGEIDPAAVRVFYLSDVGGEKKVTNIGIDHLGVFDKDWPGGFFPQRYFESLELAKTADRMLPLQSKRERQ